MKEKIKRISSSTWALILALMMVVSSFSVLAATTNVNKTGSGYSAGDTIYFSAGNTNWYGSDAKTVAYFYGNSDGRYAVFQSAGNDKNYLKATVPDGTFTTMILIRYDPNNSTFNTNGGTGWPGDTGLWNRIDGITRSDSSYNLYTVTSDSLNAGEWSKYSASDPVATSVSLNPDNSTINVGDSLKLTASTTGKVNGNVTYTFYNGSTQVGEAQTTSESTATATVSGLSAGDYTFTVKVTKDGYTEVASDPINVTVTGGSGGSVSDDIISVLNGDKIMFYITVNSSWKPTSPLYVKEDASPYSIVAKLDNSNGAVTVPQAKYRLSNSSTWEGNQMSDVAVAGYKYRLDGTIGSTTSSGSATTTVNSDNTITTDFIAGQSGDGKRYTLVYYMKDSSGNYSKVGTSADEVNTKVASLSDGIYTLYTCSTDGTITVLRDTDTIDITTSVAKSVNLTANPENVVVGGSSTLTATLETPNADNVTYTFTEGDTELKKGSSNTLNLENLTEGAHTYKVTVSADGYTSVTATVVVNVNRPYNVTAKYEITEDGTYYTVKDSDVNIVSVDGKVTSNTSSGKLVAKDTITILNSTYVFAGWRSNNGSFTDATNASTTFSPSADADVYAQYKKQYTVSASTTDDNGTINVVEKAPYLAGDTVTININPKSGYQLKSLMRTTGISGETTDVKNGVSDNKYVVQAISSNETFVAEFEKNPLDYSKYQLLGDFDGGSWSGGSGLAFNSNGQAVITLKSSGKQFKFYNTVAKTQYGSTISGNQVVTMGTEYTTTINDGNTYKINDTGTFIIEIVDIDSNGVPKFKVTKDDTISNYQLYISKGKNDAGKLLGNFTKAKDDGTYQYIITVDAGTHYFYIKDSSNTDSTLQYSDGRDNCELGTSYLMNKRNNVENIQYKLSAGSYKVTYGDFNTNGEGKFKIDSLSKPLAESVTLSSSATAVKKGVKVTLTAKINNKHVEDGEYYTYTFYDGEGNKVEEKTTTELTASCETTSITEGVVSYKVVVSTDATYTDPEYPTVNLTYTDISSDTIQVDYREKILYIAEVKDGKLGQLYQLTKDSFKPANGAQSVTIAVFTDETISDDTVCNLTVSESKNKYTTITSSTIDTDDTASIPTYTINCNAGASSPTIYIVDDNIYAVATFDMGATNTFDNTNTVDYYFAEPTDDTGISNPTTGDGLRVYYWNNSVADQCGYADVTTKVDKDGKASGSNTITVNMGDLYSSGVPDSKTFNVYKVSLPVWATSFKFVSSGETTLYTKNTFVSNDPNGDKGDASIGLNPNRIYLLYQNGSSYYSRGVVLDSSFWTETSRENNDVPTKNFKANAVNYNTQYDLGGNVTNDFNKNLNALYDKAYANPLFFGYVKPETTEVAGNQNFRIQDNLAMRHDNNHAYYASVQGLAGNTLSSTSKNENGCGYLLTADGSSNMPLFDYDKLKDNTNVASNVYEGLNFPFNESTFNGITTYSYDSFTDKNRVIDGDFKVDTYSNATVGNDKGVGFFPFDNSDSTNNANKYGFGTEFDIDFYMSETGKLTDADGKGKDITFNFSGDDDVWVYVDGVLVLDLGGAHKVSSGSINFSDMKVIYKAAVDSSDNINNRTAEPKTNDKYATDEKYVTTVDLAKIFKANGAEFNNKNSSKKHTLQMFYMERGSFDSNCSISFNLPQNTGLLVRNDVNFDSVNPGLKDATMGIANKDYFSYMIENKYASDAEFTKLKSNYGTLPSKTTSENKDNFTFGTSNPLYPIVTADNIIRRVVNGTTYYLAVKDKSGNKCQSYWSTILENAYKGLPSINFSLPDDFAKLESSTDDKNSTAVSGQTDANGGFNLLFNQSAKFNSKIPSNTMVKVVQNETLYEVNAGDSKTAMSVASDANGKVTRRNVSNFYSTSYKITDDRSQKIITEAKGNKNSNVFSNDTSAGTDGFYFADYSENHSDSSAMTVNFTNTVSTSDIKIIKKVSSTDSSDDRVDPKSGDRFTFTVKLSNIFGDNDTTLNEYENLTYKVYDSSTGKLEGTRTYGKSGVSITANEYAVITGIPVGTRYEVTEKQRTGYQFVSVNGEFVATTLNSTKAAAQTNEINDTNFIPCNDSVDSTIRTDDTDAKTVKGYMPIANDANNNAGKTVQLTYTNKEAGFTISFKYYDREVTTGTVAHINTKPTVVNYVFSVADLKNYRNEDGTYDYASMITNAVTAGGINPDNVIDSYKCFTSQADAETGIQKEYSYRNYDETNSKYLTYGEAYSNGFAKHTDCYGRLQGSDGAVVSDGEDWVSYYNGKTKYATEEDAKKVDTPVTSITVWFFNNLKTYKPTFMYATNSGELKDLKNGKFVGNEPKFFENVFYNVRLGVANGVDSIDEEGFYLKEYGVTGFTGTYSGTAMSIQNGEKELKFLYWSYDENGKSIASNSYKYGYRITNNIKLYAIYGEAKDNTNPGLTVSMNNPDYHIDSNGNNRVRLNTVMNVYNCPDDDPNIKNVAVIYILDPNNFIEDYIKKDNTTALKNIRDKVYGLIKANGSKAQFSGVTIKINGTNDNKALGLTYTASKELLTNKNRVQFTTDFKQSALADQKIIYTFSAMNYYNESATEESKTDWIVSDNCIKYIFDANGKVTGDSTQVNCLQ